MLRYTRRRSALRRGLQVRCQAVLVDAFHLVGDRILDLSHRGAQITCEVGLVEGDELVISFEFDGRPIDAVAEVRNVSDDVRRAGVTFTELDWDARVALFLGLHRIPPRIPRRRLVPDYAATVRSIGRGRVGANTRSLR